MDAKTNEKIDKMLAVVCEDTTIREALRITFSVCAAVAETVLDQVVHTEEVRTSILEYCDMLRDLIDGYEPKPK
jgi:hypothetical protein